jgi:hypothetical protein
MERIMTSKRTEELLSAYGADSRRWPENERVHALALIEQVPELRALIDEARSLDIFLDRKQDTVPAAALARVSSRIESSLSYIRPVRESGGLMSAIGAWFAAATWPRAAALAGVAVIGIIIGLSSDPSAFSTTTNAFDGSVDTGETSLIGEFSSWSE